MRLHHKLLSVSVALVLAAVAVVIGTALAVFSDAFEQFLRNKTDEALSVTTNYIEDYRLKIRAAGESLARSSEFRDALKNRRPAALAPFVERVRDAILLADLAVYDPAGRLVFTSKPIPSGEVALVDAEFVRTGLNLHKTETIVAEREDLLVKSVHPVVSADFEPLGVILLSYPLNNEFLDLLKIVTNTHLVLFDPAGRAVATTFADNSGRRLLAQSERLAGRKPGDAPGFPRGYGEGAIDGKPFAVGLDYIFRENRKTAGLIGVAVEKGWFVEARRRAVAWLISFTGGVLLLAIFLSFRLSHSITTPLRTLTLWAAGIHEGKPLETVHITSRDEVGELARAFNAMVDRLLAALHHLETANSELDSQLHEIRVLFDVSQTINYIPDTNELLVKILDKTIDATGADHASIMLLDDEGNALETKMVRGVDFERQEKVTIAKGIGIAGLVIDRGEPILVRDTDEDPRFVIFNEDRKVRSLLCVPLLQSGKPFGVLNVVIREARNEKASFDRKDLRLSISIANQIALVIDKAKLYQASITDGMTKLYIHHYFKARLREEMRRSVRYGKPLSLIMCDIDHFKNFNDTYGHQVGDRVLVRFADIVRGAVRDKLDIAARYGGEEFAVICPETPIEGAVTVAERIRQTIESEAFPHGQETIRVTASFGVATLDDRMGTLEALVKSADNALYVSKENGRNRVTVHCPVADSPDPAHEPVPPCE